jgi:hypothetical protein
MAKLTREELTREMRAGSDHTVPLRAAKLLPEHDSAELCSLNRVLWARNRRSDVIKWRFTDGAFQKLEIISVSYQPDFQAPYYAIERWEIRGADVIFVEFIDAEPER